MPPKSFDSLRRAWGPQKKATDEQISIVTTKVSLSITKDIHPVRAIALCDTIRDDSAVYADCWLSA